MMAATVGMAIGQNSDVTTEAAGVVVMDSSLAGVDELMHISRRMRTIALQSAAGGMVLSVVNERPPRRLCPQGDSRSLRGIFAWPTRLAAHSINSIAPREPALRASAVAREPFPMTRALPCRGLFRAVFLALLAASAIGAPAETTAVSPGVVPLPLVAKVPRRAPDAMSGSEFVASVRGKSGEERERAILRELLAGNLPPFLLRLKPIEVSCPDRECPPSQARLWVMPDYLAIGSDEDFVRFPANFHTATTVARRFGFVLPTPAIVDAIYEQAELRLTPQPMTPGPAMTSTECFFEHEQRIRAQMRGHRPGELAAGHKKDYVLTNRLAAAPSQEAIYGWHRAEGSPIQPLSLVHGARYADYSHGVRLVSETVFLDGVARSFYDLLAEPSPALLLSREGVIAEARRLMAR